ncbi:MAG: hypothetical protein ACI8TQ_002182, partial [Planctomycetota bacterium]
RDGAESAELEAELPAEVAQALSTALEQWRLNTTATWAVLQTSLVGDQGSDQEVRDRLQELGYLR